MQGDFAKMQKMRPMGGFVIRVPVSTETAAGE
jgi:hypothetical protein